MKEPTKFAPYNRTAFLATVPARDAAVALRLCTLLEAAFAVKDISIYSGFPIVVRDMEWIAGFAMRAKGPIAYCCSPHVLATMGAELKPFMSGKSCIDVRARKGFTLDEVVALVGRAFVEASTHGGMICKADIKKREKLRAKASATKPAKKPAMKPASRKS